MVAHTFHSKFPRGRDRCISSDFEASVGDTEFQDNQSYVKRSCLKVCAWGRGLLPTVALGELAQGRAGKFNLVVWVKETNLATTPAQIQSFELTCPNTHLIYKQLNV